MNRTAQVKELEVVVTGTFLGRARLGAEYYDWVEDAPAFLEALRRSPLRADLFTFVQHVSDRSPHYDYFRETDSLAVLPITSYENWWKAQVNDKTRNMIRKAGKAAVELRVVPFDDALVNGIMKIYNESPVRQGKAFKHYQKDFETLKRTHVTFQERSDFIGAFYQGELIGFAKLVHGKGVSSLMQIISMIAHRDKAPTNALIAKAVEICTQKGVPFLHYGIWGRAGGLGDFKKHHAFQQFDTPRYTVPLTWKGKVMLRLKLHRNAADYIPETVMQWLLSTRARWTQFRHGSSKK